MQRINIITGNKLENGEAELVQAYIEHFLSVSIIDDKKIPSRELQRPIFIICNTHMSHRPVNAMIEKLESNAEMKSLYTNMSLEPLHSYEHDVNYISTKQELVNLIEKELNNDIDVHFYISNMDSIIGLDELHEICSKYPNDKTKYSADFTVEYTRRSEWREKLEMEYKTLSNRIDSLSLFLNSDSNILLSVFERMLLNSQLLQMKKLADVIDKRLCGDNEIKVGDIVAIDPSEIITTGDRKFIESIGGRELRVLIIEDDIDNPQTLKLYTCVYNDSNELVSTSSGKPFPFYNADIKKK